MIKTGIITVCSGEGGVPVIENDKGDLEGVPAVIDKDKAGEKLSEITNADFYQGHLLFHGVISALFNSTSRVLLMKPSPVKSR